jgi:fibronectin type 3 domain-containing protein
MKNVFFVFLLAIFCQETFAKDLSLDSAISAIAADIMKSPKIGKWKKIVLTDFSDSIEVQNYIEEELANKLINNFTIIDRKNLGILREELEFQNTGKVDPADRKKIGSVYGADFVLWGTLKNGELTINVENVQGATDFSGIIHIEKNDIVLKNLEKNTPSICLPLFCGRCLPSIDEAIKIAVSHLSKKIFEDKKNKILVYNIWADRNELSESISQKIKHILSSTEGVKLINRDKLGIIETEMSFQASGEVDANTIKERGKLFGANAVIYGNIRPIGNDYRLFLYAVNVENAKIIATYSQRVEGNKKEIKNLALPDKINGIKVEALSSDKIIISWENISNARNFIVYRINPNNSNDIEHQISTGANRIIDLRLKAETVYCYSVQSRNTVGTGEKSEQRCATTHGVPKLGNNKPEIKDKTENSVAIKWNKIPGASHYNVSRCLKNKCNYSEKNLRDTIYNESGLQNSTIYEYFIEAVNSAGIDTSDRVDVITKPIPPINIAATEIFADKIKLKWEDKQENISHYIIEGEGYSNNIYNKMVEITKLKPETTYQFRLKSVNTTSDESEFSKVLEVKTSGKPNAPDSVKVKIDSTYYSKTITINWHSVSGADDYVIYRNNEKLEPPRGTLYQEDYSRLEKGIEYTYSISARNAAGESERIYVPILTEPPEPLITKKDIDNETNRFFIEWNPIPKASYRIEYKISDKNNEIKKGDTLVGTDTFFKRGNLPYSSILTYCIIAINKMGESGCSEKNQIEFRTLDVPQKPYYLKALAVSADSIMLKWNAVQNASSYALYLCEDDRFGDKPCKKLLYEGSDTNYVHTGLKANKEYKYALAAKNAAGYSNELTYEEEKTYIPPPTNIEIKEFGLHSVKITWQKADGANYYKIYRKEGNGDSLEIDNSVRTTEWVDEKIEAKKEYSYYIAAISEKGKESTSEARKHKTTATGTLILKNENNSGYIITGYEIKKGSETIEKDHSLYPYISRDGEKRIPFPANGANYELYITTNSPKGQIKGEKPFKIIKEGEETIFIYKDSLREKPKK